MRVNPDEIRQQFEQRSDEGLLSIDRNDLTELAQQYYDAEVARRGLHLPPPENPADGEPTGEELVAVATFLSLEEANLSLALLRSADIPATLENENSSQWAGLGGLRLLVPEGLVGDAEEILDAQISDEDLEAQAEAAGSQHAASEDLANPGTGEPRTGF